MPRSTPQQRANLDDAIARARTQVQALKALPAPASRTPAQDNQAARATERALRNLFRAVVLIAGADQPGDGTDTGA